MPAEIAGGLSADDINLGWASMMVALAATAESSAIFTDVINELACCVLQSVMSLYF